MQKLRFSVTFLLLTFVLSSNLALAQEGADTSAMTNEEVNAMLQQENEDDLKKEGFTIVATYPNAENDHLLHEAKPGDVIEDYVTVRNTGTTSYNFEIYTADSGTTNLGTFALKGQEDEKVTVGKWTTFASDHVLLEPDETKTLKVTITVPEDTEYGFYEGGIAMEREKPSKNLPKITIASRVVQRVQIRVTEDPQEIPKRERQGDNSLTSTIFFYSTLGVFALAMVYLGFTFLRDRKKKKK